MSLKKNRPLYLPLGRLVSKNDPFECNLPLGSASNRTLPGTYLGFLYLYQETPWSVLYHVKGYPTKGLLVPLFSLKGLFLETQEGIRRGRSGNLFDAEGALFQKKSRRMVL